jgi:hypothetical protein
MVIHLADQKDRLLRPLTARQVCELPDPPVSDVLLGPYVVRRNRLVLVGDSGHGKTTLALQMVAGIVTGGDVLGHRGCGGGVRALIVDLEQGLRSIKRGLREADLADRDDVICVRSPDGLALDSDPEHVAELDRVIAETQPAVVVLDPYYKAHQAADPNAERPIVDLMRVLDALRDRHGFALILPAHPRKQAVGQNGRARKLTLHDVAGSGAIVRGAEVVLGIERGKPGYARLRYLKDRDGDLPGGEALPLLFSRGEGFRVNEWEVATEEQLVMRALEEGSEHEWWTLKEWRATLKIREQRARELLARLTDEGLFEYAEGPAGRDKRAKCWRVLP